MPAADAVSLEMTAATETSQLSGPPRIGERLIELALGACAAITVLTTVGILIVLAQETWEFLQVVPVWSLVADTQWTPLFAEKHYGVWPLVAGTFLTSAIAISVALPCGLLSAIYMSEIASVRARRLLKPAIEVLAGIPSLVYGFFALVVVTPLLQRLMPELAGYSALSAGLVMGMMLVPTIGSLSEDAIHAIPRTLREASYALGADRVSTILRVVVPSAASGIMASVILAVSRAVGETMIVAIAAGQQPRLTMDPRVPIETMTAYIVQVSMGDTPAGSIEHLTVFVVGTLLFLLTFLMNVASQTFSRRLRAAG